MTISDDINRLESELEAEKRDFRRDVSEIDYKVQTVREELKPSTLIHKAALPLCGAALMAGFIVGYLGVPSEVRRAAKDSAKEAAKGAAKAAPPVLIGAGTRAALRRWRG
jgi:hypothetical protein